ncbi:rho GDP-dissociation inhibitor 1 isoform X2 [Senna tora]|uniref:Rho GDP-dissociation inhibitor 1 isoform X2 n=1 Tax=Senna tora TaxID=362788 RepID=A0A834TQT9_9FABA|nr:rho GDP-dissociation inhibitor 1 isoform X2 [Senna tora]
MGLDEEKEATTGGENEEHNKSESSFCVTENEDDEDGAKLELGPPCSLKEQLEKDKDDESLRRWKEQLLGSVDVNDVGETLHPEVKITSLSIVSPGRDDIVLPIPEDGNPKGLWFTLKEVDSAKEMIGTFSPQSEPYTHEMPEETTPSGMFARGSYTAKSKFVDDDDKCHLEINYTFDIRKDWA